MSAHLNIHVCITRKHRAMGRQYARGRSMTIRDSKGQLMNVIGHRELKVCGYWIHERAYVPMREKGVKITDSRIVYERERYDFMDRVRSPRIEIGSTIDPSGYVNAIAKMFNGKVLQMLNDKMLQAIQVEFDKVTHDEYSREEFTRIMDFLKGHKGKRVYSIFW
jgi:hypothetical protein